MWQEKPVHPVRSIGESRDSIKEPEESILRQLFQTAFNHLFLFSVNTWERNLSSCLNLKVMKLQKLQQLSSSHKIFILLVSTKEATIYDCMLGERISQKICSLHKLFPFSYSIDQKIYFWVQKTHGWDCNEKKV